MSALARGDLCVVLDHPLWHTPWNRNVAWIVGCHVILLRPGIAANGVAGWRTTRYPHWLRDEVLRKIEPPPMDVDEPTEEELTA
jgi:hypothetical protein